ncbi:MAG: NUDIX domain-containing protein [Propionibacteriaceae bacterium]
MSERTVRLEVPSTERDPGSYLRAAWRLAIEEGAERVELLVATSDTRLRRAAHHAGFLHEGVLRRARTTSSGTEDMHLYAVVAGDEHDSPAGFSHVMNAVLPRTRVIAHALFRDVADRVLVLAVSYKDDWELPGGIVEPHEPPRRGAEREVLEEIGLERSLGQPLVVDWLPPHLGWDDAVEFIFDGGVLTPEEVAAITLNYGEISAAHWLSAAEAGARMSPLAARRLEWIDRVRPGTTTYFEEGRPLG